MLTLIHYDDCLVYPDAAACFSPSVKYPEYPFQDAALSDKPNQVYDMVRQALIVSGYDSENIGTKDWNPFGDGIIQPGDTVLIKPNWVMHENKAKSDDMACLVTNPSVLRAIIDYSVIALKGTGRIIVADAPMQGCDLQLLFKKTGYDKLFDFYTRQDVKIQVKDLRHYSVATKYKGVIGNVYYNAGEESVTVDLGQRSLHFIHDDLNPDFRVEDYSRLETAYYHTAGKHIYSINRVALEADVIINVPKPKTHRLAGLTGAVKNFVGITYDKASLPHRMEGDKETGAGDAYFRRSIWKRWMGSFNEKRTINAKKGNPYKAKFYDYAMKASYLIGSVMSGDAYRIGSWYGNDTIWRTAVDLANIALNVDKAGIYHEKPIRKIITVGDMIISGEKEGPVGPSPKPLGIIVMSDSAILLDYLICHIMGFSEEKLPMFNDSSAVKVFGFNSKLSMNEKYVKSNEKQFCASLSDIVFPDEWRFEPHSCWKGHIE